MFCYWFIRVTELCRHEQTRRQRRRKAIEACVGQRVVIEKEKKEKRTNDRIGRAFEQYSRNQHSIWMAILFPLGHKVIDINGKKKRKARQGDNHLLARAYTHLTPITQQQNDPCVYCNDFKI